MTDKVFILPDLGEGLTEGEIVRWLVAVGDTVVVDQPVAEIETAKAIVEVPTPFAGTVAVLHGAEGDEVAVGAALLTVTVDAPANGQVATPAQGPGAPVDQLSEDLITDPVEQESGDGESGNVLVGYGTSSPGRSRRRGRSGPLPSDPAPPQAPSADAGATSGAGPTGPQGRPLAKPPVRKLAKDLGVDLSDVQPSGANGVITRDDVRAAVEPAGTAKVKGVVEGDRRIPLRGVRRRIADRMSQSRREIPEATTWVDCDATALMAIREDLNATQAQTADAVRVSPLALILRIVVAGLAEYPQLNASIDGDDIVQHAAVHLGFAAQTDRGLVVPVIRDAQHLSALQIAAELTRLAEGARAGSLTPAEMMGSTFTVSNYGSFGVDGGNPVINYPEAAILGVGRITDRPWAHEGEIALRKVMQLSVAFDHRIADGGEAAGFLRFVADRIEHPSLLLATL